MKRKKTKKKENKFDAMLDFPKEISTDLPKITMLGFEEMLIENYKGILEYEEYFIKISTYIGVINISGFHLELNQMKDESILITGEIESFSLEKDLE